MDNYSGNVSSGTVESSRILYTASEFAKKNLIYLQEAGHLTALKKHESRRQKLDSYLFFIVTKGSGTLTLEDRKYELNEGSCVLLDCRKKYSHETSGDNKWSLSWTHFYGSPASSIYEEYIEKYGGVFSTKQQSRYVLAIDRLISYATAEETDRDMLIFSELCSLLSAILTDVKKKNVGFSDTKQRLFALREYLDLHYRENISLDGLAAKFNINKFYLTRVFRRNFGVTVVEYLIRARITGAKYYLRFTDRLIEDIALDCGINDAGYFNKLFRKYEGMSPGEFRKMWGENKGTQA